MSISVGEKLPEAVFRTITADGPKELKTDDVFAGKKVVLFAVPGAYTPSCHARHLPGFLTHAEEIKNKGVDTIACVSVNDMFVMDYWAQETGGKDKLLFLSDGNADFTKAIGLEMDVSVAGMGIRSQRYVMIVDDGVVTMLSVEEQGGVVDLSSAETVLKSL